jgi:biopolymer transport protein ExbD
VEIDTSGGYMLDRKRMSLNDLEAALIAANRANPKTVVNIRADKDGKNKDLFAVIDRCQRNGITRFSLRTEPTTNR